MNNNYSKNPVHGDCDSFDSDNGEHMAFLHVDEKSLMYPQYEIQLNNSALETAEENLKEDKVDVKEVEIKVPSKKLFVYLLMTEQCIPEHLISSNEFFANSDECKCEVIIFSFKEKCLGSIPSHVEYIYRRANTWNTARNILYKMAQSRNIDYLYYVFLDDDIQLGYNEKYTPVKMKSIPPMRAFEQFLNDHEPAVGLMNYRPHHNSENTIESFNSVCSPLIKPNKTLPANWTVFGPKMPLHLTVVHFDAMLNAYHRDAVKDLLPYTTFYDFQDWTFSQKHQIVKVELLFRGHAVMFTPVNLINPLHRDYPKNKTGGMAVWKKFIIDVAQDIPFEYSNDIYLKQFLKDPVYYREHSLSYCYNFPPKYPIKKFSHFTLKWSL